MRYRQIIAGPTNIEPSAQTSVNNRDTLCILWQHTGHYNGTRVPARTAVRGRRGMWVLPTAHIIIAAFRSQSRPILCAGISFFGAGAERSSAFRCPMRYAGAAVLFLRRYFAPGQLQFITSSVYRCKCEQSWLAPPLPGRLPMNCIGTAAHPVSAPPSLYW